MSKKDTFNVFRGKNANSGASFAVFENLKEKHIEVVGFDQKLWLIEGSIGNIIVNRKTYDTLGSYFQGTFLLKDDTLKWKKVKENGFSLEENGVGILDVEMTKKGKEYLLNIKTNKEVKNSELVKLYALFQVTREINQTKEAAKTKSNRVYYIVSAVVLTLISVGISASMSL